VRIDFNDHIRTIVVLPGGKLTEIYFLSPGGVNPGPISGWCEPRTRPLKMGLLKDSPYHVIEIVVRRAMSHDRIPRVNRDMVISCGHFRKT
jgi:hypothetical protein